MLLGNNKNIAFNKRTNGWDTGKIVSIQNTTFIYIAIKSIQIFKIKWISLLIEFVAKWTFIVIKQHVINS